MIPGDTLFSWPRRGRESVPQSSSAHCSARVYLAFRGTFSSFMCCRTTIVLQAICAEVTEFLVFTANVYNSTLKTPDRRTYGCGYH